MSYQVSKSYALTQFRAVWTWQRVFDVWRKHSGDVPEPLFQTVRIRREGTPETILEWWPKEKIAERQAYIQRSIIENLHRGVFIYWSQISKGEDRTLHILHECQSLEEIAATLIAASLRRFVDRGDYTYEKIERVVWEEIYEWAWQQMPHDVWHWHHNSVDVLPYTALDRDTLFQPPTLEECTAHIARKHQEVMAEWQLIELTFDNTGDELVISRIDQEIEAERERIRVKRIQEQEKQIQRERELAEFKRKHPRAHHWPPKREELQELVWSMPTIEVASLFGVSDVAVAKHCRNNDVPKPPVGFWAKVTAGKIPHPQGKPVAR